jgi:sialic acid synthase SpsE
MPDISIAGRRIGSHLPPFIVAELSANHGGNLCGALAALGAAKAAGADAVKLQTYRPDTITIDHDGPDFRIKGGLWAGRRLYELYEEAHMPWGWHETLFGRARELGVTLFSTPFDPTAVELLERLQTPAYKIASFEMIDLQLVRCVAATGKPTIISTGMANPDEIGETVDAFRSAGGRELVLLHCVSGYPTPIEQSNLRRIPHLTEDFGCPVGLSDHTLGTEVAIAAVALGAPMAASIRRSRLNRRNCRRLCTVRTRHLRHWARGRPRVQRSKRAARRLGDPSMWSKTSTKVSC